jgi:tRNA (cmo5U34)-methyltransferase
VSVDVPTDWTFRSAAIAEGFDRHVREQLPWYEMATGAVVHIARHYIGHGGLVYDVGAATGNIGRALESTLAARSARLIAVEASSEMAARYRGPGELVVADALALTYEPFDVAVCFLVLMFLPVEHRRAFVRQLLEAMKPGGALILFEKVITPSGYLSTVLHRLTIAGKVASGADPRDIVAKELSLSGVQRPLPIGWISCAVGNAVEVFRFGEFVGWVVEKPE